MKYSNFFKNWFYHLCYTKDHDFRIKLIGWRYVADLSKYFHQDNYFHCSIEILNNDWSSNFPSLNNCGFNSWIFTLEHCRSPESILNFNSRSRLVRREESTWYIICGGIFALNLSFQLWLQQRRPVTWVLMDNTLWCQKIQSFSRNDFKISSCKRPLHNNLYIYIYCII